MKIGRNDPCPCGSGKKYKRCCLSKNNNIRSSQNLSLDQRTKVLYNAMHDLFFNKTKDWDEVKKRLTDERIKEFYKVVAWLWPPKTDVGTILPRPDGKLRALYIGRYRPELIIKNIVRYSLYTDEILIILPLVNPWSVKDEFDPIVNSHLYASETLRSIYMLNQLNLWVQAGLVKIIPDLGDFDYELRKKTWELGQQHEEEVSDEDIEQEMEFHKEDFARELYRLPIDSLKHLLRRWKPEISEKETVGILEAIAHKKKTDPLIFDAPPKSKEEVLFSRTGANLELGLYVAQLTGAYLYTDIPFRWRQILSAAQQLPDEGALWAPLTKTFQSLEFKFLDQVSPKFACNLRTSGRLENFRSFLRKTWTDIFKISDPSSINSKARGFSDELVSKYHEAETEWAKIDKDLLKWIGSTGGIAKILSGGMRWEIPATGFCIAAITELLVAKYERTRFRQNVPMSVFLDLKTQTKK